MVWSIVTLTASAQAEGTILSIVHTEENSPCCPVELEYQDADGVTHIVTNDSGGKRGQVPGDKVTVFYDPTDPGAGDTVSGLEDAPATVGFAGVVLGLIAWLGWRAQTQEGLEEPS